MEISKTELLQRFTAYAEIDTASDDKSTSFPSSAKELDLAKYLTKELTELGFSDVEMTEYCYVLTTLPANGVDLAPLLIINKNRMKKMNKLLSGVLAIMFCIGNSAHTKLPPAWQ